MTKPLRALVVEDNENDALLMIRELRRGGYEVAFERVDTSGAMAAALEAAPWDIILSDYSMPGFGGLAALRLVGEKGPDTPFILVSGVIGEDVAVEAMRLGAHDYVLKHDLRRLVPAVERELREAEVRRQCKKSEDALRESETRFRRLAQSNIIGIMTSDRNTVIDANDAFLRMIGCGRMELTAGHIHWPAITPPEYASVDEWAFAELLSNGYVAPYEKEYIRADGGRVPVLLGAVLLEKDPPRWIGFVLDLTESKRLDQERERSFREQEARELAEATNRIKDQFLATLSHELRTPLNAILGWSEMINRGTLDPALLAHAADVIHRNAKVQAQLIDDILDVSRIVTGKFQLDVHPVELTQIVEATVESVRPAAEAKSIAVDKIFLGTPCVVSGDPTRLQQIVWNLLSNAVKFTPKGGRVRVELRCLPTDAEIVVSDTGQGVSPEFLPHVFERFQQEDSSITRSSTGLGLGLSIVRHLVELHGGTVRAESEGTGKGSTFTIRLPLVAASEGRVPVSAPVEGGRPGEASPGGALERLRILVVDDHVDTRELLAAVLQAHGAEVETAASAAETLEKIQSFRPDVLVADIGMPGEDGYSMMKRIRSLGEGQGVRTPALALTGYAGSRDRELALEAGYQMHMAKPVDPEKLVETVAALARKENRP